MSERHEHDGYDGPAQVLTDQGPVDVTVTVRGAFQPIDGRFHWHGRVVHHGRLDEAARAAGDVVLRTPEGEAAGRLSDEDPWGRLRIAGTGRPPYRRQYATTEVSGSTRIS